MTADEIIAELSMLGVTVACPEAGRIRLTVVSGDVPPEAIALVRKRKPELLRRLWASCSPHNDPTNYIDTPDEGRPGWIRSTCRVCGRFIGCRQNVGRELGCVN